MALWHKLKRAASQIKNRTRNTLRRISGSRPSMLRSDLIRNFGTIIKSLFVRRDRLKPALTRQTQMIAQMKIPTLLRRPLFRTYSALYGVKLKEVELPLKQYATFSAFFTRRINRPLPAEIPNSMGSPCDGKVLVLQQVTGDKCQVIKGAKYSLSELTTGVPQNDPNFLDTLRLRKDSRLLQLVIYLAPGDYHRFHSPSDLRILRRLPIEGRCDSVSQRTIARGKAVYEKNGRVVVTGEWREGLLTMVMVGALNVMRIQVTQKDQLERGEELGFFNLGSTIVMIVEVPRSHKALVSAGQKVQVGQPLFTLCE